MQYHRTVSCLLAEAGAVLVIAGGVNAGEVSLYRGGLERTGGEGAIPDEVAITWRFKASGPVNCAPVIADGSVYVATGDGTLHCLDAASGSRRWKFRARHKDLIEPAVAGGRVLLASSLLKIKEAGGVAALEERGLLHCLDARSGEEKWIMRVGERIFSVPAVAGGRAYFGGMDRRFRCIDIERGDELWDFRARGDIVSSPALTRDAVIFGSEDGCVYALDTERGRTMWKADLKSGVAASPAVSGEHVFAACRNGTVHCLDLAGGKPVWKYRAGRGVTEPAAVDTGKVVVTSTDGTVHCLGAADGRRLWTFRAKGPASGPVCIGGGRVVVASRRGGLLCLDARSGREIWRLPVRGELSSAPTLSGETLFVGSAEGMVYAVGPAEPSRREEVARERMSDEAFREESARALSLINSGRYGDAVVACERLVAAREDSAEARMSLARSYEGLGELERADREYKLAVQLAPQEAAYRNALGGFYARMGRMSEALREFGHAKALAPGDPEGYLRAARANLFKGNIDEAELESRLALERSGGSADAFLCAAEVSAAKLDFAGAREMLRRCLALDPGNKRAKEMTRLLGGGSADSSQ